MTLQPILSPAPHLGLQSARARVLVVEDDPDMCRLISTILRHDGYEVVEASDGLDLLDWAKLTSRGSTRGAVDVIVSDVSMPHLSALEVLSEMQRIGFDTPVVLITAFGDDQLRHEASALGVDAVLDKPLDADELRSAVRAVTRHKLRSPGGGDRDA